MRTNSIRLSALLLALLVSACATPVGTTIKPTEANIAKYSELSALDIVTAFEKNVADAKAANMAFLAPHYLQEATQVLTESQNGLSHKPKEQLAQLAAKGDAILDKGRSIMSVVQYRFTKELELKAQLDKLNTNTLLPKEYEKVMDDFSSLVEKVEREKSDNIDKSKESLIQAMQGLEIRAVQEGALRESETINSDSKAKNAEKQIPATYAEAVRAYTDAKTKIAAAPHDNDLVVRLSTEALFAARHARQLNDRVTELQAQFKGTSSATPTVATKPSVVTSVTRSSTPAVEQGVVEKIVVQEEDRLLDISTALGYKDLRDQPLDKQVQALKNAAANTAKKAKDESSLVAIREMEIRLQTANATSNQTMAQLSEKAQQLIEKDAQIAAKDAEIIRLNAQIHKLEDVPPPAVKSKRK